MTQAYTEAGVDIGAGHEAVRRIKDMVSGTHKHADEHGHILMGIGGFCALFEHHSGFIIGFAVDGPGTKVLIATLLDKHDTIMIDVQGMCFNDLLVHGVEPVFFLDYIAMGKQVPDRTVKIIEGMVHGCHMAHVAAVGGEMAEMAGMYEKDHYDIAGFAVGFAPSHEDIITGSGIRPGMRVFGLPSSGVHANGLSLIRRVFSIDHNHPDEARTILNTTFPELDGRTLGEELLTPTRIYTDELVQLWQVGLDTAGLVHITGDGLKGKPDRVVPDGLALRLQRGLWEEPPVFELIKQRGGITDEDMFGTFNMGIGMIAISKGDLAGNSDGDIVRIGEVIESDGGKVIFV